MYKVVGNPMTRTMRVLWMLEELGQDYEIVVAAPHSDAMKQGNPGGKMPALHVDGDVLTDSVAIVTYLADKHRGCTAAPGTIARARQDAMTQFCVDEVEGALWTDAKNDRINPEDHRGTGMRPVCEYEFAKAMGTLAQHLEGKEFVAGESFSVADLLLGHCAGWAANAKFTIPEGTVANYLARMRARPALSRALKRGKTAVDAAA